MPSFFISYHRDESNATYVEELLNLLDEHGYAYWIDTKIRATEDWRKAIDNQIRASQGIILVATKASVERQYVTYEWAFAMGANKTIVVLACENGIEVHPRITPEQYIRFYDEEKEWDKLLDILRELSGEIQEFSDAIQKAIDLFDEPDQARRELGILALNANRTQESLDALAHGCKHPYTDVSLECALTLAQKSNYKDQRCIETIKEHLVRKYDITGHIDSVFFESIIQYQIVEAESLILAQIKHCGDRLDRCDFSKTYIANLYKALDSIIDYGDMFWLKDATKYMVPGSIWKELADKLLKKSTWNLG